MYKFLATLFFIPFTTVCIGQKYLLFYNTQTLQTIEMKESQKASILYKGYMGQTEFACETVTLITDSTITLGVDMATFFPNKKAGKSNMLTYKVIRIADIIGFRRMTLGRQLAKLGVGVAGIVGSFYLLQGVYTSNMSGGGKFLLSFGTGLGILGINRLLFPENIKHYFADGWQVKVMNEE